MTNLQTDREASPRPHPWRAILLPTLGIGGAAGGIAGAIGTFGLSSMFWMLVPFSVVVGGLVGVTATLAGLIVGAATWAVLGVVPVSASSRATVAAIIPATALVVAWFTIVFPALYTDGAYAFTVLISAVIVATAVVLPVLMRRRFLTEVRTAAGNE